jgi:hypothetical protein
MRTAGIVLIVIGLIGLAYGGISWTTRDKVVDLGPVEVTKNKTQSIPLPPLAGGLCVIAGVVLAVTAKRNA